MRRVMRWVFIFYTVSLLPSTSWAQQNLLDIVVGELLQLGKLTGSHRALPRPPGQAEGYDQPVFTPRRDAHATICDAPCRVSMGLHE